MRRTGGRLGLMIGMIVALVIAALAPATAAPAPDAMPVAVQAADLESRFLTTRPPLGPTWVVSIAGESAGRTLTARTLQGLVNRSAARLYLIDGGDGGAQALLDRYVDRGLVTIAGTTNLNGMLDEFASEAAGYVLADPNEPWSVHGASVIATVSNGVVATADQVADLAARGLPELDDTRGRWPDAVTAYQALAATYGGQLASDTVAVIRPSDTLWDFVAQQGILPVFTRPDDPAWTGVRALFDTIPDGSPVYGYLSDTGEQEVVAVAALAATDLVLVPTDTTRNLSFHLAVGADRPRVPMAAPDLDQVAPCRADTVNVVVGVTDGDNLNVPLNHFQRAANWDSPSRGDLPIGWSIGPGLAVLAPAAWDGYALEATASDELVGMIGWGYGSPALLPDATDFYATTFELMDSIGMQTFWSLGGGLDTPNAPYWDALDAAAGTGTPTGVLVGYGNGTGSAYYSPAGRPAFTSRSIYSETPADLAAHVTALLATPPADRPLVTFLSATNWSNPVGQLIDALVPFEAQGVRFLTPSEATACMPPAPPPEPPPTERSCLPAGPVSEAGVGLISHPVATEIQHTPTPVSFATSVAAPASVLPGATIDYTATIEVDLPTFARTIRDTRVKPIVQAGYGKPLADTAWVVMAFEDLVSRFPIPPGTTPTGDPSVATTGAPAVARWANGGVEVEVPALTEDTRTPGTAFTLTVTWSVVAGALAPGTAVSQRPGPLSFDLALLVGVRFFSTPLEGSATASWACVAATGALATTAIADPLAPTTTTTTSAPASTTSSTSSTAVPPGQEPTVTTAPATAPPAVAVAALPQFAG